MEWNWFPDRLRRVVYDNVAARLERAGVEGVRVARELVPIRTGQTRDSIGYRVNRAQLRLQIYADTPWAIFVELGTRHMAARPFLRPALATAARVFGGGNPTVEIGRPNPPSEYLASDQRSVPAHTSAQQGRRLRFHARVGRGKHE